MATLYVTVGQLARAGKFGMPGVVFDANSTRTLSRSTGAEALYLQDGGSDFTAKEYDVARCEADGGAIWVRTAGVAASGTGIRLADGDSIDIMLTKDQKISAIDTA